MEKMNVRHRVSHDLLENHDGHRLNLLIKEEVVRKIAVMLNEHPKFTPKVEDDEYGSFREYKFEAWFCDHDELMHIKAQLKSISDCNPMFAEKTKNIWNTLIGDSSSR